MTKESCSIHFKRTWKDLKDSEIIGRFFLQVTGGSQVTSVEAQLENRVV